MVGSAGNPYFDFRKFLTRLPGITGLGLAAMRTPMFFAGAVMLLMLATLTAPTSALAGCGCDKPPPKPAAVTPNVAAPGMPIIFSIAIP